MKPFQLETSGPSTIFRSGETQLRIWFVAQNIVRITLTKHPSFLTRKSRIITHIPEDIFYETAETDDSYTLSCRQLRVVLWKKDGALSYFSTDGTLLVRESADEGNRLTRRVVTRNLFEFGDTEELEESTDGIRAAGFVRETIFDREAFEARVDFVFSENEALFGFGSHEEGYASLRGRSRDLYQQNMKAVIPHFVSTRGYGILFDCSSLMTFHDDEKGSYWWADCVDELDYYMILGKTPSDAICSYRTLTGKVPLPPKWAFGYVQSKERYVNAAEILDIVREYRRRTLPLDIIVLDWKSWPDGGGWGQKSFDPERFPDPSGWIEDLHQLGAKLMISTWPTMTGSCSDQRELLAQGFMLGNGATYNAFSEEARRCYCEQAEQGLMRHGVDAWWSDCTEPFEADWNGPVKPGPEERLLINTSASKLYLDAAEINAYSLVHSQGIYEHQRRKRNKRVLTLTRSSYAGQSRYGTFTWNGDICATWDSLRHSIAEGLNFCAAGEPYWTVDAGGFFLASRPDLWFWRGDYDANTRGLTNSRAIEPDPKDTGCKDLGFHELYVRWMQYAAFLPMMRSHGTDAAREVWRFGEEGTLFYDAIADAIRLRYRFLPYIYSTAAAVTFEDASMMLPVALVFPEDTRAHHVAGQYMFGPALLVCPVTHPMLFAAGSVAQQPMPYEISVYLPGRLRWYDFWSEHVYSGSQHIQAAAPIDRIPLFVREGSVVVLGPVMQFVEECADGPYAVHVYAGADADFLLYEDDGVSYAYEQGLCARTKISWDDAQRTLTFAERTGEFDVLTVSREMHVLLHTPDGTFARRFTYSGALHVCTFEQEEHSRA